MPVNIVSKGDYVAAALTGELDHHNLIPIRQEIDTAVSIALPKVLLLDFGDVTFMDSSGVGLILGRMKLLKSIGGTVALSGAEGYAGKVIRLAGLAGLILKEENENANEEKQA
ncbi:MAG: anti-sigma factor antagonist [Oscillospiraceae bacterium]|nr:anti-sigma factor antagonist [Oscillospiraceae bacterium]